MDVVALGPEAASASLRALRDNGLLALVCDRDLRGDGVEVEFFGEKTTMPAGPAMLALRARATIVPVAVYFRPQGGHHAVVRPPLDTTRRGSVRDDVARITQELATEFEGLIAAEPQQWHLLQPNWPSDHQAAEQADQCGTARVSASAEDSCEVMRVLMVCPYSLTRPGGVQGQALGLTRELRKLGIDVRLLGPCDGPPPGPGVISVGPSRNWENNGSVAPIAAGKVVAHRTLDVQERLEPDIVHLHEPVVPGPTLALLVDRDAPTIGTFHISGELGREWLLPALRARLDKLAARVAVSESARDTALRCYGPSDIDLLWNGVEVERFATAGTVADAPARRAVRRPPRAAQGSERAPRRVGGNRPRRGAVGRGQRTADRRPLAPADTGRRMDRTGDRRGTQPAPARGHRVLRARGRQRVVRGGAARGDGRGCGGRRVAHRRLRQRRAGRIVRASSPRPATPVALRDALRQALDDAELRARLVVAGRQRAEELSMARLAEAYADLYEEAVKRR